MESSKRQPNTSPSSRRLGRGRYIGRDPPICLRFGGVNPKLVRGVGAESTSQPFDQTIGALSNCDLRLHWWCDRHAGEDLFAGEDGQVRDQPVPRGVRVDEVALCRAVRCFPSSVNRHSDKRPQDAGVIAAAESVPGRLTLKRSPVMLPIPGTSKVAHLEENVTAVNFELSSAEFDALDREGRGRNTSGPSWPTGQMHSHGHHSSKSNCPWAAHFNPGFPSESAVSSAKPTSLVLGQSIHNTREELTPSTAPRQNNRRSGCPTNRDR